MPPDPPTAVGARRLLALAAIAVTAAVFTPLAVIRVDPHHDGIMLKTALDVLSGQRLFRDTFTQYGPLTTYVHVAAMWAFGPGLLVLKLVTVAAYALSAGVLTAVWARILPVPLVVGSVVVWLLLAPFYGVVWPLQPWSSAVALLFQALSLAAFACALDGTRLRGWAAVSGACAALAVWARTPVGLAHTGALVAAFVYVARAARRRDVLTTGLGSFGLGALATHLAFFGVLVAHDTVPQWFEQTIVGPATWAQTKSAGLRDALAQLFPGPASLIRLDGFARWRTWWNAGVAVGLVASWVAVLAAWRPTAGVLLVVASSLVAAVVMLADPFLLTTAQALALAIPIAALALAGGGIVRLVRSSPSEPTAVRAVAFALAMLASWLQYFPTSDPQHVFWAAAPGVGLPLYALFRLTGRRSAPVLVVAGILLLPLAVVRVLDARALVAGEWVAIDRVPVLAGLRASAADADEYTRLWEAIHAYGTRRPDVPMVVVGGHALVATFAPSLRNPGPYFVQWASAMKLDAGTLDRFITRERALVLVEPIDRAVIARFARDLGYRELIRTPGRAVLAPAE